MSCLSYYVSEDTHIQDINNVMYTIVLCVCLHCHTQDIRSITNVLYANVLLYLHWHNTLVMPRLSYLCQ
jgi:hypothetical protein